MQQNQHHLARRRRVRAARRRRRASWMRRWTGGGRARTAHSTVEEKNFPVNCDAVRRVGLLRALVGEGQADSGRPATSLLSKPWARAAPRTQLCYRRRARHPVILADAALHFVSPLTSPPPLNVTSVPPCHSLGSGPGLSDGVVGGRRTPHHHSVHPHRFCMDTTA